MSSNSYYLDIPVDKWDLYCEHIVKGIYNVKDGEYKVTGQHNGVKRIEFKVNNQFPLINSLPRTVVHDISSVHDVDRNIIETVSSTITTALTDYLYPGGNYHISAARVPVPFGRLKSILYRLARESKITKFCLIRDEIYIIYVEPHPVSFLLRVVNGTLNVNIYTPRNTFDIDDGYSGILTPLNTNWTKWKEVGDITAPIQPPNFV